MAAAWLRETKGEGFRVLWARAACHFLAGLISLLVVACGSSDISPLAPAPSPLPSGSARPKSVMLNPIADATTYQAAENATANGAGEHLLVGFVPGASNPERRGILRFAISQGLPAGAQVRAVTLRFTISQAEGQSVTVDLHRVLRPWRAGSSNPGGDERSGELVGSDDVTWIDTGLGDLWSMPGGDFDPAVTISAVVSAADGTLIVTDQNNMMRDVVQFWLDNPDENFGWLLKSSDDVSEGLRGFFSSDVAAVDDKPQLLVSYNEP